MFKVGLCVPTLNAGPQWREWLLRTLPAASMYRVLIIDSTSEDETAVLAEQAGCEVTTIARSDFDHGGTRGWAIGQLDDCEIIVFLTQDAIVADSATLDRLVEVFDDPLVGAAFGRQLPHDDATPIAAHARFFNYPSVSYQVSFSDVERLGIKAAFLSNSFAAYRREALIAAGGFPTGTILSEDMIAGARLLKAGWKLHYCADAQVYHSHNYSVIQECRRYFDIGVLHRRESWLLDMLGRAEGEGKRYVLSETKYLLKRSPMRLPEALIRNFAKYIGYRLGKKEASIPLSIKRHLSMHHHFWK
ncbi:MULTISPECIES: glycosyltransferase family 2 protein [Halomonadaceae]|uniref:glycosyltransferase family 2 protein n=1 Tax=Halomonadaceae TaxID=28256 RepID=UPI0015998C43|nr:MULTISPECIES: glycosyltransferase [unclassified Halomonas]QJQ96047.1 glycosyltransferase [Halomonas sp. PA5]